MKTERFSTADALTRKDLTVCIYRKFRQKAAAVYHRIRDKKEKQHLQQLRKQYTGQPCSIISNNCVGGVIYHNLGLRFDSPTINLYIKGIEYLEFCKHLEYYAKCPLVECTDSMDVTCPVGTLIPTDDDHIPVHIYFEHDDNFAQAKEKWMERFSRVDYDNVFFIWEFYDTLYDHDMLYSFDRLPLKHKLIITHRELPDLQNAVTVHCYQNDQPFAQMLASKGLSGKRYLDEIDYVDFLNRN